MYLFVIEMELSWSLNGDTFVLNWALGAEAPAFWVTIHLFLIRMEHMFRADVGLAQTTKTLVVD